jgi:YNFM family putative membrane transporter
MNNLTLTHPDAGLGRIRIGTSAYLHSSLAFFAAGFVTFVTLYDVQPLLPEFSREFGVSPAIGSLPLSVATATMAITMLFAGTLSETWGRKQVMAGALFLTSMLSLLIAVSHTFSGLIALRLLQGFVLAGLPAVAMAYLSEELDASAIGSAMGLYIGGNAVGGMTGRIVTAAMTDFWTWRAALGGFGVLCLLLSLFFVKSLPPSHLPRRPFQARYLFTSLGRHLGDPLLLCLYGIAFLAVGSFVTLYNYLAFRLLGSPYGLTQSHVSFIFLVYLLGSMSASTTGRFSNRFDRAALIRFSLATMAGGALLTLAASLPLIITGVALFTIGFFGTHSVASSWVGRHAATAKAQASALYLFFYYLGSSVSGTVGGVCWSRGGWSSVTGLILLLLVLALAICHGLAAFQGRKRGFSPVAHNA